MDKTLKTLTKNKSSRNTRIKLLPIWMKLLFSLQITISVILMSSIFLNKISPNVEVNIYGFRTLQQSSFLFVTFSSLLLFNLFSGILLIRGVKFGLKFGKLNCLVGIVICSISVLLKLYFNDSNQFYFPIEIILLILIFTSLKKIEKKWNRVLA